jgi:hypothetical protein
MAKTILASELETLPVGREFIIHSAAAAPVSDCYVTLLESFPTADSSTVRIFVRDRTGADHYLEIRSTTIAYLYA